MSRIYLDHAATSPMNPEVIEAMAGFMAEYYGNPSSIHAHGRESRRFLDKARETIASSIHAGTREIIFTSGGTEADNMAIIGTALANRDKGNHIITTEIEHHAVLHTCAHLEKQGCRVTYLPVDKTGKISLDDLKSALSDETILVTIMYGNNEAGTIQPVAEISELLKNHQSYFHTDAVQAFGLLPIDVRELGVDLLSVSGHKINGPKGAGFLYAKSGTKLSPIAFGGEQELKRRAGTENSAGIIGLAKAVELAENSRAEKAQLYKEMKKAMLGVLKEKDILFEINGDLENSLPHVLNLYFPGTNVESLLVNLDIAGVSVSSGSACTAGSIDPSHVLTAMFGKDSDRIAASIRFSFGMGLTIDDVKEAAIKTAEAVSRLTANK
ncbi:cysteine desulfurase [Metabacillus sp. GX 13764]|uniref:cysteine desulfurase family protein n=1 Tax=Metabacillus kandeliae TaxID=2900151 RepID=UPI001E5C6BAF|nr:cysteine desulfurase family protein [Metabacillus kandeliae]MCD7032993.1 cysteine desulfurase [Metabacillus kandeliae]